MKIKANVKYVKREWHKCPDDHVHVAGKDGKIKGCHALWFDDKLISKGSTAFYWPISDELGCKVFYSFGYFKGAPMKIVKRERKNMQRLAKGGYSPDANDIIDVDLDLYYSYKKMKIKKRVLGIRSKRLYPPEPCWTNYMCGIPYDWDAIDDYKHNPKGFIEFQNNCRNVIKHLKLKTASSLKLGDVMWDTKTNRWWLCDVGL